MKGLLGFMKTSTSRLWLLLPPTSPSSRDTSLSTSRFTVQVSVSQTLFRVVVPQSGGLADMSGASVNHIKGSMGVGAWQRNGQRGEFIAGSSSLNLCGFRLVCFVSTFFLRFVLFWLCLFCCSLFAIRKFVSPANLNHNLINELPISNGKMQKNQFVIVVYEVAIHFFLILCIYLLQFFHCSLIN